MDRGRLEAFSDGVFAVAITLLALDLAVPGPGHGPLMAQLIQHWPAFLAYVISFFTVGVMWVNHHQLVGNVTGVDRVLLFLNLVLLLFIVAVPFATSTMAKYLLLPGGDARVAMALFAAVFEGMALSFSGIFLWTLPPGRTTRPVPPEARRTAFVQFSIGALGYLLAVGVAFISPPASLAIAAALAVYYAFEQIWINR